MHGNRRFITLISAMAISAVWVVAFTLLLTRSNRPGEADLPTLVKLPTSSQPGGSGSSPVLPAGLQLTPSDTQPVTPSSKVSPPEHPVPDSLIIQFNPDSTTQERETYLNQLGGTISQNIDGISTVVVSLDSEAILQPADPQLVVKTEPDYYVAALADEIVNDPYYGEQWSLQVIGAASAWAALSSDMPSITVAIIDSGICAAHPDLSGRIAPGWDFVQNDIIPQDEFGHGCAVAGIIASNMDNGIGIAGIAPNTQIMPLRVLDAQGIGRYSSVAAAIVWAADSGAQIINLSLGGYSPSTTMENAIRYATQRGVLVIAAAGNTGTQTVLYPAAYPGVVAVGAVNQSLEPSSFSSYGPNVDIWAPGQEIITTSADAGYRLMNGTSFAAPHVAGVAALEMALGNVLVFDGGIIQTDALRVAAAPTSTPATVPTSSTPDPDTNNLPELFLDTDVQGALDSSSKIGVLRNRYVDVNFNVLPSDTSPQAQANSSTMIVLNLFEDVSLVAARDEVTTRLLGNRGFIWSGQLTNEEYGEVVLVVDDGLIEGHVLTLGKTYQISYAGNGVHVVNEIDPNAYKLRLQDDGLPVPLNEQVMPLTAQQVQYDVTGLVDDGSTIDVMVVYTTNARTSAGSVPAIEAAIEANILATNKSYANSGVNQRLRLRHTAEVAYTQDTTNPSLGKHLDNISDNLVPNVFSWRNTYKADLVVFIVETTNQNTCGVGWQPTVITPGDPSNAGFNVVEFDCLAGGITFAHELGHNMGVAHDLANAGSQGVYSYGYGHQDPSGAFHTVMAYYTGCPSICPGINYWSNPSMTFGGKPLGTANANNAVALNNTAPNVAQYRDSGGAGPAPTATSIAPPPVAPEPTSPPPDSPGGSCNFSPTNASELISAINQANANGSSNDNICLNGGTYTLTAVNNSDFGEGPNGLPVISTTITIIGNNSTITRSSASNFRHFYVRLGDLRLDRVMLTNGNLVKTETPDDWGGSILNRQGKVTITNSTFTGNSAQQGGAIANIFANGTNFTTTNHTHFTGNKASFGGVFFNYVSDVTIADGTISGNVALDGGAIFHVADVSPGTLNISGNSITENAVNESVDFNGDGQFNYYGAVIVQTGASSATTVTNNCIFNNANYAIQAHAASPTVNATNNWWGDPIGPSIGDQLGGDLVGANVNYTPFLSVEAGACTNPPPNDDFDNRIPIPSIPSLTGQTTVGASTHATDPVPTCGTGVAGSVWYTYTPSTTGPVLFRTDNSSFDTVISIWTGSPGSFSAVGCDDDSGPGNTSRLQTTLTAGTNYQVMIAGDGGMVGGLNLQVSAPTGAADILVTNTNDSGAGSLREAINTANITGGTQTIGFEIPGLGVHTINLDTPLPQITDAVIIEGRSQFGYVGTPLIELNGTDLGQEAIGLNLAANNSIIRGLIINQFGDTGIFIAGDNNTVESNYIGTGSTGSIAKPNGTGIKINGAGNTIGGTLPGTGNLVSGNSGTGIYIATGSADGNIIQGNLIGTNASGTGALPNYRGIQILNGAQNNTVGGTTAGARNVISGNTLKAVLILNTDSNTVQGNFIGVNINGNSALPNGEHGIEIDAASSNTIGGTTGTTPGGECTGACNLISGNGGAGIHILNTGATGNNIQGNFIGTNVQGTSGIPNSGSGVLIRTSNNLIGGGSTAARNVISGNTPYGVQIFGSAATGNTVQGNFIGTNTAGTSGVGNTSNGLYLGSGASSNIIGPDNIISGNNADGVRVADNNTLLNVIKGNRIGTNAHGTAALPNLGSGVNLVGNSASTTVGGTTTADRNLISGNNANGVKISSSGLNSLSTNNVVQGNFIGTDVTGTAGIPNLVYGVFIDYTNFTGGPHIGSNLIGGTAPNTSNTIAFNTSAGVAILNGTQNTVNGNAVFNNGALGIDLESNGVTLNDGTDADTGSNHRQNFPNFTGALLQTGNTIVYGILTSSENTTFRLEFFSNETCDASGYGEGQTYLGSTNVTINPGTNSVAFDSGSLPVTVPSGHFITMTATDPTGNTSEFSKCPMVAPASLLADSISQVQINLSWTDSVPNETAFIVDRSTDATNWTQVAMVAANQTSYQDTGLYCNTTYYYRVKAYNAAASEYSAYTNVASAATTPCAVNNAFAQAIALADTLPATSSGGNFGASLEPGEQIPTCGTNVDASLWYTYTPGSNKTVLIDTIGSTFDTVLSVWTGNALGSLNQVTCDNDSGFSRTSYLQLSVTSGTTYRIMVAGNSGANGNISLKISQPTATTATPMPSNTPLPSPVPPDTTSQLGLYKNSVWWLSNGQSGGLPDLRFAFGSQEPNWKPIVGNWDGDLDQVDTIGLYKNGLFWLRNVNANGFADLRFIFGPQDAGWTPIAGDWNGDGVDTIGIYKNGLFLLKNTNADGSPDIRFTFGPQEAGWTPIAGDWNKDGFDTIGLYKDGMWLLRNTNSGGSADTIIRFGRSESGWSPITGRWDALTPLGIPVGSEAIASPTPLPITAIVITPTASPSVTATAVPPSLTPTSTETTAPAPATETPMPASLTPTWTPSATTTPTETSTNEVIWTPTTQPSE